MLLLFWIPIWWLWTNSIWCNLKVPLLHLIVQVWLYLAQSLTIKSLRIIPLSSLFWFSECWFEICLLVVLTNSVHNHLITHLYSQKGYWNCVIWHYSIFPSVECNLFLFVGFIAWNVSYLYMDLLCTRIKTSW